MSNNNDKTRFNTSAKPNWCPGCGNYGIQSALKKALLKLELEPHQVVLVSGIGIWNWLFQQNSSLDKCVWLTWPAWKKPSTCRRY